MRTQALRGVPPPSPVDTNAHAALKGVVPWARRWTRPAHAAGAARRMRRPARRRPTSDPARGAGLSDEYAEILRVDAAGLAVGETAHVRRDADAGVTEAAVEDVGAVAR